MTVCLPLSNEINAEVLVVLIFGQDTVWLFFCNFVMYFVFN